MQVYLEVLTLDQGLQNNVLVHGPRAVTIMTMSSIQYRQIFFVSIRTSIFAFRATSVTLCSVQTLPALIAVKLQLCMICEKDRVRAVRHSQLHRYSNSENSFNYGIDGPIYVSPPCSKPE